MSLLAVCLLITLLLVIRVPIAFAFIGPSLVYLLSNEQSLGLPLRLVAQSTASFPLLAVPLFILMGYMTEQAGLMQRLFLALRDLLAPVRGALYVTVILTAAIFAMATGIVGAAVTVLGIMAGAGVVGAGYDPRPSSGAIPPGGALGILIPPSVMLGGVGPPMGGAVNFL